MVNNMVLYNCDKYLRRIKPQMLFSNQINIDHVSQEDINIFIQYLIILFPLFKLILSKFIDSTIFLPLSSNN